MWRMRQRRISAVLDLHRRRTPDQRTVDEHSLLMADLELVRTRFARVDESYFHLLGLLALPLIGRNHSRRRSGHLMPSTAWCSAPACAATPG
jgi:hypothetical protein